MHSSSMNIQSSTIPSSNVPSLMQLRGFSHKRRRSATFAHFEKQQDEDNTTESCCTTSGESSGDESDDNSLEELIDEEEEEEEEETLVAVKRRRRADLDGLKKSVRRMEAQVVNASAQLKDLAAVVAQVAARRQHQQWQLQYSAPDCIERRTIDTHLAKCFSSL
ncbi:hypothetical protein KXD40_008245 [Peronospora effusa]|uniref:Uncharacterized protein n=1 Tax=Peronospora effusa TaxID=542832 RepID=A0A425CJ87_9STRA|nr:hypothetical protein DD237_001133 [Peronospora effusa]UIZ24040.1 hypothetical protein KXD40_008245 [Peronospora effusa]